MAIGDGKIVVGAGADGSPQVNVYDAETLAFLGSFFAFSPSFTGGVDVAVGAGRIIVGAGPGGTPHVNVFDENTFDQVGSFLAFDRSFTGGVNVATDGVVPEPSAWFLGSTGLLLLLGRKRS